jgi:hypothetical protein
MALPIYAKLPMLSQVEAVRNFSILYDISDILTQVSQDQKTQLSAMCDSRTLRYNKWFSHWRADLFVLETKSSELTWLSFHRASDAFLIHQAGIKPVLPNGQKFLCWKPNLRSWLDSLFTEFLTHFLFTKKGTNQCCRIGRHLMATQNSTLTALCPEK